MTSLSELFDRVGRRTAFSKKDASDVLPPFILHTSNINSLLLKVAYGFNDRKRVVGEAKSHLWPGVSDDDIDYLQEFEKVDSVVRPGKVVLAILSREKQNEMYLVGPSQVYSPSQALRLQDVAVPGLNNDIFKSAVERFLTESLFFTTNISETSRPEIFNKVKGVFLKSSV